MYTALTIAGSDSSGGAGIQADLKTMMAHGVFGMSAITALTAQNTLGVTAVMEAAPDFLAAEIDSVFLDIPPDAVKVGMVSSSDLIAVIGEKLREYKAKNIVVDPVMVATSGARLLDEGALTALKEQLLPLAKVITPNLREGEVLVGHPIENKQAMEKAAREISAAYSTGVLIKGGHSEDDADDLFFDGKYLHWIKGERINNPNTHGTGCTLSSAIASNLALGMELLPAIKAAKKYVTGAIAAGLNLGQGRGPLDHAYGILGE